MDSALTIKDLIEAGGVMGFAGLVWLQIREQTRILSTLRDEIKTIRGFHRVITERQRLVAEGVIHVGRNTPAEEKVAALLEPVTLAVGEEPNK